MKLIVNNQDPAFLEREGKLAEAAEGYEKVISEHPLNARAYDRLMIVYRKLKEPEKELKTIETAIRHFEESFKKNQTTNKRVVSLSRSLLKATGLADKKGNNLYEPGELSRWKKRKDLLLKKLKSRSAKRKKALKKD